METHRPIHVDGGNFLSELGQRIKLSSMEKLETAPIVEKISIAVQGGNNKLSIPFPAWCFPLDTALSKHSKAQTWPQFNSHALGQQWNNNG